MPNFFGMETLLPKTIVDPSKLLSLSSGNTNDGNGQIKRNESVTLRLAGVVTQVLPNGNLVVDARQEIRVNNELRVLQVTGVIRPQDIASDNTVQARPHGGSAHCLWRTRGIDRRAIAALGPAADGHPAAVLRAGGRPGTGVGPGQLARRRRDPHPPPPGRVSRGR